MSHASEQHFYKTSSLHIETRPPLQRSQDRTAADFTGLLDLLAKIIAIDFEDLQKPVTFTESDPKDNNAKDIPLPIITMKLIKEVPHDGSGRKDLKPRIREIVPDPNSKDDWIQVWGQWKQAIIEFRVHADTNRESNLLVKRFKEFMIIYQGMIMAHGVQQMIFLSQESDETVRRSEGASEIHVRPVQYMIVFDELVPQSVARLREVIIKTGISDKLGGTENETILTDIGGIDRSPIVPAP